MHLLIPLSVSAWLVPLLYIVSRLLLVPHYHFPFISSLLFLISFYLAVH